MALVIILLAGAGRQSRPEVTATTLGRVPVPMVTHGLTVRHMEAEAEARLITRREAGAVVAWAGEAAGLLLILAEQRLPLAAGLIPEVEAVAAVITRRTGGMLMAARGVPAW